MSKNFKVKNGLETTNITASSDISSSGIITAEGLVISDDATITDDLTVSGQIELGHASDTSLTRASSGDVNIEGNIIYRAGGTDVPVADGGTGASTLTDGGVLLGSGTSAITAMAVLTDGQMIVGDGSGDPVAESGATLRTSIGVGTGDNVQFTNITGTGNTTLGNAATDTHTITGHITASANISSSGTGLFSGLNITHGGTAITFNRAGHEQVTMGQGNADKFFIRNANDGRNDLVILDDGKTAIGGNDNPTKTLVVAGDISASGDLFVDDIAQVQHITASGNISASLTSTGSYGKGFFQAPDPNTGLALHASKDDATTNFPTLNTSTTFVVSQTQNAGGFNGMTVLGGHSTGASIYKFGDKDNEQIGRFIYYHQHNRLDTFVNNSKAVSIDSSQRTGFGGIDAPQNTVHISGSMLVGTGSIGGHITASGNISGSNTSTFRIGGKLIAGSKSFLINTPDGGKLEYGVLEGQQNDVFYRGELKGDNTIYLPQEWEWLVDENTITTQLTSIGKHQELFVKEIKENKIFIDINGMFKTKENIHCYYIIHGTRKDIELIRNHQ